MVVKLATMLLSLAVFATADEFLSNSESLTKTVKRSLAERDFDDEDFGDYEVENAENDYTREELVEMLQNMSEEDFELLTIKEKIAITLLIYFYEIEPEEIGKINRE